MDLQKILCSRKKRLVISNKKRKPLSEIKRVFTVNCKHKHDLHVTCYGKLSNLAGVIDKSEINHSLVFLRKIRG
mgnify:CR=1 FL=1